MFSPAKQVALECPGGCIDVAVSIWHDGVVLGDMYCPVCEMTLEESEEEGVSSNNLYGLTS